VQNPRVKVCSTKFSRRLRVVKTLNALCVKNMKKIVILISLIFFLLIGISVYSQEAVPSPPILSQSQQNKTKPQQTKTNYKERGSDDIPLVIKAIEPHESQYKEGNHTKNTNENTTTNWLLVIFNGLLAVFTFFLVCYNKRMWEATKESLKLTKDSTDLAREEFITSQPPKLKIHNVVLKDSSVIGEKSKIIFDITNIGGNTAHIIERNITFVKLDPRPNILPYSGDYPDLHRPIPLERGRSSTECLPVDVKIIENIHRLSMVGQVDTSDYYFFGYIDYFDDFNASWRTAFCRRYNIKTKRFTKVEDEHYEYNSY